MKLNYKNVCLSIGTSLLLCSALQAVSPVFKTCPTLNQVVHSVINVKEPLQKIGAHVARIASSIVLVESCRNGNSIQTSGFLISENGFIITNYFHIKEEDQITVTLLNGEEFPATLVQKGNTDLDAAILKIEGEHFPYLSLETPHTSLPNWIFSIGSPTSGNYLLTIGTLKEKNNSKNICLRHIETDSLHSGSPLLDLEGNVIGMHLGSYPIRKERLCSEPLDKGFAIPLSVLQEKKAFLEESKEIPKSINTKFLIYSRHYKYFWK